LTRGELEHVIRACAEVAQDDDIVVLGSQAILAQYPDAPASLRASVEADVYPRNHPERADLIDGNLGELSLFHETHGYYAHGVGPETASMAPDGWQDRLVPVCTPMTRGATGWCMEANDLVLAKCAAGREKDLHFAREAIRHRLVRPDVLETRLATMPLVDETRESIARFLAAEFARSAVESADEPRPPGA